MPLHPRWHTALRCLLRVGAWALLFYACVTLFLLLVHQAVLPLAALILPQIRPFAYDVAVYGIYPTIPYETFDLLAPQASVAQWEEGCDDGSLLFLGPYGEYIPNPGPTILDPRGELVWQTDEFYEVTNFRVQQYRGENYLTFWSGVKDGAKGKGAMYMLDSSYQVAYQLQAVGEGLWSDLHEFQLTDDGTAIFTIYFDGIADLRNLGMFRSEQGWITDCMFQEIDVETGELLFQWIASDHLLAEDTRYFDPLAGFDESRPFDFFHINSIEKDSRGNYLISSRHFHAVMYIDGTSGDVLWTLGPGYSDFTDISEEVGAAVDFRWQHHARWVSEEEGIMTLFNNGVAGPLHMDAWSSRGMLLQVNESARTVQLLQTFDSPTRPMSNSQGSIQALPNGDVLIGWGSAGMWTQFDSLDGHARCEVHFGAAVLFYHEYVKSYRIFKSYDWVGKPLTPPTARSKDGKLFVSWNGATEVAFWQIQGQVGDAGRFEALDTVEKRGFEDFFLLPDPSDDDAASSSPPNAVYTRYRVAALDANHHVLGISDPVEPSDPASTTGAVAAGIFVGAAVAVALVYLIRLFITRAAVVQRLFPWRQTRPSWRPWSPNYLYSKL